MQIKYLQNKLDKSNKYLKIPLILIKIKYGKLDWYLFVCYYSILFCLYLHLSHNPSSICSKSIERILDIERICFVYMIYTPLCFGSKFLSIDDIRPNMKYITTVLNNPGNLTLFSVLQSWQKTAVWFYKL